MKKWMSLKIGYVLSSVYDLYYETYFYNINLTKWKRLLVYMWVFCSCDIYVQISESTFIHFFGDPI